VTSRAGTGKISYLYLQCMQIVQDTVKGLSRVIATELHIYIEEVERKGLGRETGLELPAMSFSKKLSFFL